MNKNLARKGQLHKALSRRRHARTIPTPVIEESISATSERVAQDISGSRSGLWVVVAGLFLTLLVFAVVIASPFLYSAVAPVVAPPQAPNQSGSSEIPTPLVVRNALSGGVIVSSVEVQPLLVAISVDNMLEGRPASGIDQAPWVFEFPAESTITLFMAVFDARQDVEEIGPVRSMRPYMIDFAQSLGAVAVHSGGSPDALKDVAKNIPNRRSINEFSQTPYFWRDSNRSGPHNLYTALDRLREHPFVKALTPALSPLLWQEAPPAHQETPASPVLTIGYLAPYTVHWSYHPESKLLQRQDEKGTLEKTRAGATITANTVVIQFTDIKILDAVGRRNIRTLGQGDAMVVSNGTMELAHWVRKNANDRTTLVDVTGAPLPINPGKIWWTVVPKNTAVSFE